MIDGYWTALVTIMLIILLLTGWSSWLNKQMNLFILLPSLLIIWLTVGEGWNFQFKLGQTSLLLNASFVLINILLFCYWMLTRPQFDAKLIMLYTVALALALTMIRALMMISPWAEATFSSWQLPLVSGILLSLIGLNVTELILILFWGTSLTELLLMWQQRGEYSAKVANLPWWDFIVLALASIVLVKLLLGMLHKGTQFIVQLLSNRMKS